MSEIATISDLIAQKMQKEEKQNETLEITVGNMEKPLVFRKLNDKELIEFMGLISDADDMEKNIKAIDTLIYNCCPALQDTELHNQLDVNDPEDIPSMLWTVAERIALSDELSDFLNLENKEIELKNS